MPVAKEAMIDAVSQCDSVIYKIMVSNSEFACYVQIS